MGVDVNLYAEANPTPEELETARAYFRHRSRIADDYTVDGEVKWHCLEQEDDPYGEGTPPRVVANVSCRYYGDGYERGDWPSIYGAIRLLQAMFPNAPVCYGGDTDDTAPEVTQEFLDEMWAHFLGPDGDAYYSRYR